MSRALIADPARERMQLVARGSRWLDYELPVEEEAV
jgi:hypothetical protein